MGDPLWLTVINNNAQWGIVHLVAVERPLRLTGRLESLQGQESYGKPQGTNNTGRDEPGNKNCASGNFCTVAMKSLRPGTSARLLTSHVHDFSLRSPKISLT